MTSPVARWPQGGRSEQGPNIHHGLGHAFTNRHFAGLKTQRPIGEDVVGGMPCTVLRIELAYPPTAKDLRACYSEEHKVYTRIRQGNVMLRELSNIQPRTLEKSFFELPGDYSFSPGQAASPRRIQ
jgi:hypothetical protein